MENLSIDRIKNAVESMQPFFDVVRLVDTEETTVIAFGQQGNTLEKKEPCYKMWNKEERCEHCISMQALIDECQKEKYEFRDNEVYHVLSRPVKVLDEVGKEYKVIVEIVNGVSDASLFQKFGISDVEDSSIIELIAETYRKIYEDPLTLVYNRRYLEEYLFLYRHNNKAAKKIAFIMADLKKFKDINDKMGHEMGDHVLREVATVFKKNVRKQDSVIRLGGDEFIIVLVNCTKEEIEAKIHYLHQEVNKISLELNKQKYVDVDFGYSYTECFEASKEFMGELLKKADQSMYRAKKGNDR
ncbi:GGDEF domain-containing protein [Sporanaerobium hydrogeniformans]|uniref:GGDEF domain-containing protein n=1 Tax=Sporanaerobium hydrogeniformans TaxID=3072179 RepID=UPI0015D4B224|nr:GGDEF domain-containing protein [Sporanaerobium hydrogeniformans]